MRLTPSPRVARGLVSLVGLLGTIALGACSDSTGPRAPSPTTTTSSSTSLPFTIDHARSLLHDAHGHSLRVPPDVLARIERTIAQMQKTDALVSRFQHDSTFAAAVASAAATGRHAAVRMQRGASMQAAHAALTASGGAFLKLNAGRSKLCSTELVYDPSTDCGTDGSSPDICRDLSLAIYNVTQQYNDAKNQWWEVIAEAIAGGASIGPDGVVYDWGQVPIALIIAYDNWGAQVMELRTQLDILALQYDTAGCWNQPGDYPVSGGTTGGSSDGSGGCQTEYLIMEVSYDGGSTWQEVWEGWGTVCG